MSNFKTPGEKLDDFLNYLGINVAFILNSKIKISGLGRMPTRLLIPKSFTIMGLSLEIAEVEKIEVR